MRRSMEIYFPSLFMLFPQVFQEFPMVKHQCNVRNDKAGDLILEISLAFEQPKYQEENLQWIFFHYRGTTVTGSKKDQASFSPLRF